MKKILFYVLMLAVFAVAFGCGSRDQGKDEKEVIKIGAILPLTGNASFLGIGEKNAMILAKQYIEDSLIIENDLQIIFEDCIGESKLAVAAAKKLIEIDGCRIIIAATTNVVNAVIPIVQQHEEVVLLAMTIGPDVTLKYDNVFRIWPNATQERYILSNYIRNHFNRVGILYVQSDYGNIANNIMQSELHERIVITESYPRENTDFKNILTKFKDKNLDVLSLIGYPQEFLKSVRQINETGLDVRIVGDIGFTFDFVREGLGDLTEGIVFTAPKYFVNKDFNKYSEYLSSSYRKQYGSETSWNESYAFDNILFIANALMNKSSSGDSNIIKNFSNIKAFEGANGNIGMDDTGDSNTELIPVEIKNNQVRIVDLN